MSYYLSPETLYNQMKNFVTNVDTSENSYIYNALFPVAMEIATSLLALDDVENKVFASKAVTAGYSVYLDLKVAEVGLTRKIATHAIVPVTFTGKVGTTISSGSIVSTNDNRLYSTISDATIGSDGTITCNVKADVSGSSYNVSAGDICYLPVKYSGITSVTNASDYSDATDKESDDDLYARYLVKVQSSGGSGNVADYTDWCLSVDGVGAVRVYAEKNEELQDKRGHVTCVITDSNKQGASDNLIQAVKDYIGSDNGDGKAPMGAIVHIISAQEIEINITADIQIDSDSTTTIDTARASLKSSIISYLQDTVFASKKVTLNKIGSLILNISGVVDYSNLLINGSASNLTLSEMQIGVIGDVTLGAML
jgi:uncharacterized phage protein gp47/JayE